MVDRIFAAEKNLPLVDIEQLVFGQLKCNKEDGYAYQNTEVPNVNGIAPCCGKYYFWRTIDFWLCKVIPLQPAVDCIAKITEHHISKDSRPPEASRGV